MSLPVHAPVLMPGRLSRTTLVPECDRVTRRSPTLEWMTLRYGFSSAIVPPLRRVSVSVIVALSKISAFGTWHGTAGLAGVAVGVGVGVAVVRHSCGCTALNMQSKAGTSRPSQANSPLQARLYTGARTTKQALKPLHYLLPIGNKASIQDVPLLHDRVPIVLSAP